MLSLVASLAERRRMPVEGAAREGADMVMECVEFGFEEVCNVCLLQEAVQLWSEQVRKRWKYNSLYSLRAR